MKSLGIILKMVLFRTDSWEQEQALGHTSKYPKFAVALKKENLKQQ